MAKSAITLAAPPADEAADALLSTKKLIKPKKAGSIKGILAGAAAVSDGNGAPSGPNYTLFSGVDRLLEISRGRSGSG